MFFYKLLKLSPFVILTLLNLSSQSAHARDGGYSGGGGAQIESAFRIRAYDLISKVSSSPSAESLCTAKTMQTTLESTRIRVVGTLVNPQTHQPILDQDLDAWTVPGDMQLLRTWDRFLNGSLSSSSGRSVDILILHEVYRATGTCDDEHFRISDRIPSLLAQPGTFSKIYKFEYSQGDRVSEKPQYNGNEANLGECFKVFNLQDYRERGLQQCNLSVTDRNRIENFFRMASPEHPFYVVFDMQAGQVSYGMDLAHLYYFPN